LDINLNVRIADSAWGPALSQYVGSGRPTVEQEVDAFLELTCGDITNKDKGASIHHAWGVGVWIWDEGSGVLGQGRKPTEVWG
jgi:hypothetical protein